MADSYKRIREELDDIQELFIILEGEPHYTDGESKLYNAIGRKIKALISKIESFCGETSEKATMELMRNLRTLKNGVKEWDSMWSADVDTALGLMYDLLAPEKEGETACNKRLRIGLT